MRRMRDRRVITLAIQADPANATLMSSYANALGRPAKKATILWQMDTDTATFVVNDFTRVVQPNEIVVDTVLDYRVTGTAIDMVGFNISQIDGPIYSLRMSAAVLNAGVTVDILFE